MQQPREDADFIRYRETGDAEAMARVFDVVAPRLLLVASHLSRDAAEAEDLVQTTFVQVIEQAERYDAARPLLPWMLGILAHRASDARRRAGVRAADSVGEVEGALDPAELVLNSELREEVARAVDALGEPYREVVLLRLLHGIQPTQLAHTLGRPPGTVRVQLQRGLERLRRALPGGLAMPAFLFVDGRNWDELRREVLVHARGRGPATLGTAWTAKHVALALAVVAIPLITWGGLRASEREVPVVPLATARVVQQAPTRTLVVPSARDDRVSEREPISAVAVEATLNVTVLREDGSAAPEVGVHVRPIRIASLGSEQRTDVAGVAVFSDLAHGDYLLEIDRWSRSPLPVSIAGDERLEVVLAGGFTVLGFVFDGEREPVAGADIYFLHTTHPDRWMHVAVSDEEGRFKAGNIGEGVLIARADGFQPSSVGKLNAGRFRVGPRRGGRMILQLVRTGCQLSGRVVDAQGRPVPHASVQVVVDEDARRGGRTRSDSQGLLDTESILLRADAGGLFRTTEVPGGPLSLIARPLDTEDRIDGRVGVGHWDLPTGNDLDVQLVLDAGAEIVGRVTGADGSPLSGLLVSAEWKGFSSLGQPEDDLGEALALTATRTLADGGYRLAGLLPGRTVIEVRMKPEARALDREVFELAWGESLRWDARVTLPSDLQVRLLDPDGNPLAGWVIQFYREQVRTDSDGRCRLTDLRAQPGCLKVFAKTDRMLGASWTRRHDWESWPGTRLVQRVCDILPSDEELVLRLTRDALPTCSITGSVLFEGDASAGALLELHRAPTDPLGDDRDDEMIPVAADGSFSITQLSSGIYRFVLRAEGYGRERFGPFQVTAGERLDVGMLVARAPARVEVRVSSADDGPIKDCRASIAPQDALDVRRIRGGQRLERSDVRASIVAQYALGVRRIWGGLRLERSDVPKGSRELHRPLGANEVFFVSKLLVPGRYLLRVEGRDIATRFEEIAVHPGEVFAKRLICERGVRQSFRIELQQDPLWKPGGKPGTRIHFYIADAEGRSVVDRRVTIANADTGCLEVECSFQLLPGRYHARFEDHRRRRWSGAYTEFDFEVPERKNPPPVLVEIELP